MWPSGCFGAGWHGKFLLVRLAHVVSFHTCWHPHLEANSQSLLCSQHTSCSLTINENASPDVPLDLDDWLNKVAPEGTHYR